MIFIINTQNRIKYFIIAIVFKEINQSYASKSLYLGFKNEEEDPNFGRGPQPP